MKLASSTVVATVLGASPWPAAAGPMGGGAGAPAPIAELMMRAARPELPAGRAVVRVEEGAHPQLRRIAEAHDVEPLRLLAEAGIPLAERWVEWTWSDRSVRLNAMVEDGGPYHEMVYTFDAHVGILFDRTENAAGVRANPALESYVWKVHPWSYGRPFYGLSDEDAQLLRANLREAGSEVVDGRELRVVSYRDPWQPLEHRLWVDPQLGYLAVRQVSTFPDSDDRVRTVILEEVQDVNGVAVPRVVSEALEFSTPEDGGPRIPLKLRRTVIEDLELLDDVPPSTFHQELPAGTFVSNDVLDLDYRVGDGMVNEAELLDLVAAGKEGRIASHAHFPSDLGSGDRMLDVRCGIFSLYAAARLLGAPAATLAGIERATGFNQVGSNLAGLARGAQALGLTATGMRTDLETIEDNGWMGIAYLDGRHFVLLVEVSGDSVVVLDAPSVPQRWDREEFAERWNGVLLRLEKAGP